MSLIFNRRDGIIFNNLKIGDVFSIIDENKTYHYLKVNNHSDKNEFVNAIDLVTGIFKYFEPCADVKYEGFFSEKEDKNDKVNS